VTGDPLASSPRELALSSTRPDVRLRRAEGLYALLGAAAERARGAGGAKLVSDLGDEEVAILEGAAPDAAAAPVYRDEQGGELCVPTGRVLVRVAEGEALEARRGELEAAGFRLLEALAYAPHAGWVEPVEGGAPAALRGLARLSALPGFLFVEPQWLRRRQAR